MAHGLDPKRLNRQIDEIDQLNDQLSEITVPKSIEVDILEDGSLDLPDSVLRRLDLVVGAIHSHLDFPQGRQTERLLRAGAVAEVVEIQSGVISGLCNEPDSAVRRRWRLHHGEA
jgi:histidinol phosphatase-like PHP family hydrolase